MPTHPKKKDKKLDPAKAAVYVAAKALIGTVGAALIANADKIFSSSQNTANQADAITFFQDYKYDEVVRHLDSEADFIQQTRDRAIQREQLSTAGALPKAEREQEQIRPSN